MLIALLVAMLPLFGDIDSLGVETFKPYPLSNVKDQQLKRLRNSHFTSCGDYFFQEPKGDETELKTLFFMDSDTKGKIIVLRMANSRIRVRVVKDIEPQFEIFEVSGSEDMVLFKLPPEVYREAHCLPPPEAEDNDDQVANN